MANTPPKAGGIPDALKRNKPAKPAKPAKPKPVAQTATASEFSFDKGLDIPPRATGGGERASKYPLADLPVGSSFLVPVDVPANTKAADKDAVFKELAKKLSNRMQGAIGRYRKKDPSASFTHRTVSDETLGYGVRVWRVKSASAK